MGPGCGPRVAICTDQKECGELFAGAAVHHSWRKSYYQQPSCAALLPVGLRILPSVAPLGKNWHVPHRLEAETACVCKPLPASVGTSGCKGLGSPILGFGYVAFVDICAPEKQAVTITLFATCRFGKKLGAIIQPYASSSRLLPCQNCVCNLGQERRSEKPALRLQSSDRHWERAAGKLLSRAIVRLTAGLHSGAQSSATLATKAIGVLQEPRCAAGWLTAGEIASLTLWASPFCRR